LFNVLKKIKRKDTVISFILKFFADYFSGWLHSAPLGLSGRHPAIFPVQGQTG